MSTKTTFKRIALVAVASLGFGLLSAAPSSAAAAAYTMTQGTITPADGSVVVGTAVTIPVLLDTAADSDAADVVTFTATFTQKPINTALVNTSIAGGVTTRATALATAGAALHSVAASSNTLVVTSGATAADLGGATAAGEYTFTPDTPGLYKVAIAASGNEEDATLTAVDAIFIIVRGAALTQAASGKGNTSGTAVTGGSAVAIYHVPGAVASGTVYNVTSTGVGSISNPLNCDTLDATLEGTDTAVRCDTDANGGTGSTSTTINGTNYNDGARFTTSVATVGNGDGGAIVEASSSFTVDASSSVVGVQTITVTRVNQSTGVPTTVATINITWGATAGSAANAQFSTAWINAGETIATAANDDTTAGVTCSRSTTITTACANITVTVKDINSVAINNASLSATLTGPGILGFDDEANAIGAKSGAVVASAAAGLTANVGGISIYSNGQSGTATITIKSGTVTIATKTVIFYGTVATLTATQNLSVARASAAGAELGTGSASATWLTTATTPAVYIVAKDSDGMIVPGLTITAVSSDASVIVSSTIAQDDATAGDGPGYYNASVTSAPGGTSGAKATVTFRTLLSTGAYISTDAVPFTLGGSIATMTLTLDKTSYAPGEAMVVTRTALDASGNPVYDGVASPAVVFSKAVGGTLPAAGEFRAGKSATSASRPSVFAPSLDGDFEARATYTVAATAASVQMTAKATVTDAAGTAAASAAADAAAEATDAANAATDAANAAAEAADAATAAAQDAADAVAALSTSVTAMVDSLRKQITSLTNLVIKIQKKVKA